jgi:hypothetical protein
MKLYFYLPLLFLVFLSACQNSSTAKVGSITASKDLLDDLHERGGIYAIDLNAFDSFQREFKRIFAVFREKESNEITSDDILISRDNMISLAHLDIGFVLPDDPFFKADYDKSLLTSQSTSLKTYVRLITSELEEYLSLTAKSAFVNRSNIQPDGLFEIDTATRHYVVVLEDSSERPHRFLLYFVDVNDFELSEQIVLNIDENDFVTGRSVSELKLDR